MVSLGERFAARATVGFDYSRLVLALWVILWHNFVLVDGHARFEPFHDRPIMVLIRVVLPMFFALSGFLVSSSLERTAGLGVFLWHRVLRIFPALTVEVLLSAFVLGPLVTVLPLTAYFSHHAFYTYMLNILGLIHFYLPGVFLDNPMSAVNGSLWTVPSELECYIAISVLFLLGITRRTPMLLLVYALGVALLIWYQIHYNVPIRPAVDRYNLTLNFIAGMVVYRLRGVLPGGVLAGLLAFAAEALLLYWPATQPLASFAAAYAIAAFGCLKLPRPKWLFGGDYSYGLYLYACPIQQTIIHFIGPHKFFETLAISLVLIPCFAFLSWHGIEKRMLLFKNSLPWLMNGASGLFLRTSRATS